MFELVRRVLKKVLVLHSGPPEVPLGEHPEVFRASTRHLTYLITLWALRTGLMVCVLVAALGGAALAISRSGMDLWAIWLLLGVGVIVGAGQAFIGYAAIRLDWQMRWYVLTDRSLRIREGITSMREVTLTLANVQELKVSQGPIQRLLDISDLIVDTAGGGGAAAAGAGSVHGHQGVLRGVAGGSDLRKKIEARSQQRRGAGLGDPDEHADHAAPTDSPAPFLAALRGVRDEAKALRRAAGC